MEKKNSNTIKVMKQAFDSDNVYIILKIKHQNDNELQSSINDAYNSGFDFKQLINQSVWNNDPDGNFISSILFKKIETAKN